MMFSIHAPILADPTQKQLEARGFLEVPHHHFTVQEMSQLSEEEVSQVMREAARVSGVCLLTIALVALILVITGVVTNPALIGGCLGGGIGFGMAGFTILSATATEVTRPLIERRDQYLDKIYRYMREHGESMERQTKGAAQEEIRALRAYFAKHPRQIDPKIPPINPAAAMQRLEALRRAATVG